MIYDPAAADDLVELFSRQGLRAWKRTPFVVQVDSPAGEETVERVFARWREDRDDVTAELVSASRLENLTAV